MDVFGGPECMQGVSGLGWVGGAIYVAVYGAAGQISCIAGFLYCGHALLTSHLHLLVKLSFIWGAKTSPLDLWHAISWPKPVTCMVACLGE